MIIDFPTQAHIPCLRALWKEAFGDTDAFLDHFYTTGFSNDRCRCICLAGQVVAALHWFDCHRQDKRLAYIYAVATAKSHRGQGLCHKLMENTQSLLRERGYAGVVLVPAKPDLFAFYEKMGYRRFGGIRQWQCAPGNDPVSLKELTPREYAAARLTFLPADSVLQDGPLLDFLGTYTRFYQGSDFLLCCANDEGKLIGYELLGSTEAAPGILAALGYKRGTFRTPGDSPFGMYRSLTEDPTAPAYFAFALD